MIYIFDIDGVIADNALVKKTNWKDEQSRAEFIRLAPDVPAVPALVQILSLVYPRWPVYLFTARSAGIRVITQNWLYDHKIPHEDLYMRPFGNNDAPWILKEKMLNELLAQSGANPYEIMAFDNDFATVCMYRRRGICAAQVCADGFTVYGDAK